jgi:hypothetical protein
MRIESRGDGYLRPDELDRLAWDGESWPSVHSRGGIRIRFVVPDESCAVASDAVVALLTCRPLDSSEWNLEEGFAGCRAGFVLGCASFESGGLGPDSDDLELRVDDGRDRAFCCLRFLLSPIVSLAGSVQATSNMAIWGS